jgi:hypothetical protein
VGSFFLNSEWRVLGRFIKLNEVCKLQVEKENKTKKEKTEYMLHHRERLGSRSGSRRQAAHHELTSDLMLA